jgi:hypothetical protein
VTRPPTVFAPVAPADEPQFIVFVGRIASTVNSNFVLSLLQVLLFCLLLTYSTSYVHKMISLDGITRIRLWVQLTLEDRLGYVKACYRIFIMDKS